MQFQTYFRIFAVMDWGNDSENVLIFKHEFWWKNHKPRRRTYVGLDGSEMLEGKTVMVVMP